MHHASVDDGILSRNFTASQSSCVHEGAREEAELILLVAGKMNEDRNQNCEASCEKDANITHPNCNDVLFGRGNFCKNHAGNAQFRSLVSSHKVDYVSVHKEGKEGVAKKIVQTIMQLDPPGRFLQQDSTTKFWFDVGMKKAISKTRQALREGAPQIKCALRDKGTKRAELFRRATSSGHISSLGGAVMAETAATARESSAELERIMSNNSATAMASLQCFETRPRMWEPPSFADLAQRSMSFSHSESVARSVRGEHDDEGDDSTDMFNPVPLGRRHTSSYRGGRVAATSGTSRVSSGEPGRIMSNDAAVAMASLRRAETSGIRPRMWEPPPFRELAQGSMSFSHSESVARAVRGEHDDEGDSSTDAFNPIPLGQLKDDEQEGKQGKGRFSG